MLKALLLAILYPCILFAGSFTISGSQSAADSVDMTWFDERACCRHYNSGGSTQALLGEQDKECIPYVNFLNLGDHMQEVFADSGAIYWDSAYLGLIVTDVDSIEADESLYVNSYHVLRYGPGQYFEEGSSDHANGCGADSYFANDTTSGGCAGTHYSWGKRGCDQSGWDIRDYPHSPDSVLIDGDAVAVGDTLLFYIDGDALTDTLGNGIVVHYENFAGHNDAYHSIMVGTDDNATEGNRPFLTVFYTKKIPRGLLYRSQ